MLLPGLESRLRFVARYLVLSSPRRSDNLLVRLERGMILTNQVAFLLERLPITGGAASSRPSSTFTSTQFRPFEQTQSIVP